LEDIITLAKYSKLSAISITDHDTFAGTVRGQVLGNRVGVKVVNGIELSAFDFKRGRKVHLLAYMCASPDRLRGLCHQTAANRKKAASEILQKLIRVYPITPDMVTRTATGSTNIFKQHIMHTLMNAGYATEIFGATYEKLFAPKHGLCAVEPEYPDIFTVLELVHSAGGISVLAHPSAYDSMELLPELIEAGLAGVEVWHPRNTEEDTETLQKIAIDKKLIMTGGTDFHGMYTKNILRLGTYTTPDKQLSRILERK
jgi:predicted metal-dependent phosphoesterase TrpH